MDFTSIAKNAKKPSKLGIIGATRGYGYTLLAQMIHVPMLQLRVISSRHEEECRIRKPRADSRILPAELLYRY